MTRQSKNKYKRPVKPKRRDRDEALMRESEFCKLKRKLRIMDNDRKNYSHEVHNVLRKQGKEIHRLGRENNHMHESLSVAYSKYHLMKDVEGTRKFKDMLDAREDYKRLIDVETNSARELDIKTGSLESRLVELKRSMGSERNELDRKTNTDRYIAKLENRLSKMTKDFCSDMHGNQQMKEKIVVLVKEKKIYQDLYNQLTERISTFKNKIMHVTQEASVHYEHRLEAMSKMKTLKERSTKDETMFQAEMKILQRMIAHDTKLKNFMNSKENERLAYKAEEAEKRAKMSVKEKVLTEETQHVHKMETLFDDVKKVTGHADLERVVHEYTAKDDENFARFDYVSELNFCVEKLREEIQQIKDNIHRVHQEDQNTRTTCDRTVTQLRMTKLTVNEELEKEDVRKIAVDERLEIVCGAIHLLFKRISSTSDEFRISFTFDNKVTPATLKIYLGIIEQRFLQLICVLKFIGLHQDHHGNLLRAPRSIHRIRPRGPSKILLTAIEPPVMPTINTPNIAEEAYSSDNLLLDEMTSPLDINLLREKAARKITKKEAAGLLNAPLFAQEKRRPKPKKKPNTAG